MNKILVVCFLLLALNGCGEQTCPAEDSSLYFTTDESILFDPRIKTVIGISAEDYRVLEEIYPIDPGTSVIIHLDEKQYTTKSYPKGSIYAGNGRWYIKYEKNHGYMDLWK